MSDDESHNPPEESTDAPEEVTFVPTPTIPPEVTPTEQNDQASQENEAQRAMEEAARRKAEKVAQEIAEFEEQRKEEREKEQQEIQALREKREQRKREREEEDRRLAEMRAQEEARRKSEEEEKRKKKMEEEQQRKEERERKRKEQEERIKNMSKPNFVITKHSDGEHQGEESEQGEVQKSKEQLEAEKRSFLSQRIKPLPDLSGLDVEKLSEQAKELHKEIYRLMNEKYDIEEKFKRQQYDMIELAERARQMSKGKGRKGLSSAQVDESFDRLADKFAGAPPKIQLCSKYERHTDHRSYGQRLELFEELSKPIEPFSIPKKGEDGEEEGGEEEAGQEEGGEE
uniref:Troponin T, skeletal muscle-like isoform X2 n=1 Tax=Crassostrea virginica TaxID=6565 RepID=A0A8B8E8I2_CRAVI|nr:troponin T, skeletal muscle-like isoform X2 [Crassostrea virginica]XP_022335984.1 troponin T, skeletal muscle-like isoform X2 [Crassostrea virginica]